VEEDKDDVPHMYAVLFREAKIIVSNYEDYLRGKMSSKDLAKKMLNLRDAILRIENSK
jgi:hypothetical protein